MVSWRGKLLERAVSAVARRYVASAGNNNRPCVYVHMVCNRCKRIFSAEIIFATSAERMYYIVKDRYFRKKLERAVRRNNKHICESCGGEMEIAGATVALCQCQPGNKEFVFVSEIMGSVSGFILKTAPKLRRFPADSETLSALAPLVSSPDYVY